MNWTQIWMDVFGTTEWLGLNMGFGYPQPWLL